MQAPEPHPALKDLDFLVGEWELEGSSGRLRSYFFSNEGPGPFGDVAVEYFKGEVSPDGNTIAGRWKWPGGGYQATMRRTGSGE
jgi:hypothetical protein